MKPPIVINDSARVDQSGDLRVYDSIESAEKSLDREDARDDHLHVFDSEGLLLKIIANAGLRGGAHLEAAEISPRHGDTLQTILKDFLVRLGEPKAVIDGMTLEKLISGAYDKSPDPYSGERRKG